MSFNRLAYDTCAYEQVLNQSVGPGEYTLNVPQAHCEPCFPSDPSVALQKQGVSTVGRSVFKNVEVESELKGQTRLASKCASENFMPNCQGPELSHYKDCFIPAEETRTTNPACNLRGTGWNRWEWLCLNPQDNVSFDNYPNGSFPFDANINNRLVVKDNHRPCIPVPLDQTSALPNGRIEEQGPLCVNGVTCDIKNVWQVPTSEPSVHWKQSNLA